jgi:hypothetical protein
MEKINSVLKLLEEKDNYKQLLKEAREDLETIYRKCYAIGAPLNDNILKFNKEQLRWIKQIADIANY